MRASLDLTLYAVLDAGLTAPERFVDLALAAVRGGAGIVQVRDKAGPARRLVASTQALLAALRPLGVRVLVNDRVDVAVAAGADGAHVGQDDLPPIAARRLLGPGAVLGLSVTREEEIATVDPTVVDYVGLGPLFTTATKADAAPALGLQRFAAIRRRLALPVVAIGGITPANAGQAAQAGADGVAVVGALALAPDPAQAAATLVAAVHGRAAGVPAR